jgi:hypothetical protein
MEVDGVDHEQRPQESAGVDQGEKDNSSGNSELHNHFECKICLEIPKEPIATLCGHLYCWPCIYDWAKSKQSEKIPCPSCNSEVLIDKVIPLYTSAENHSKRDKSIPRRPQPEANPFRAQNNNQFGFNINPFGFNFTFGNMAGGGNQNAGVWGFMAFIPVLFFMFLPTILELLIEIIDLVLPEYINTLAGGDNSVARVEMLPNGEIKLHDLRFDLEDIILITIMALMAIVTTVYLLYRVVKRIRNR